MAYLECSRHFMTAHRTPDFPLYDRFIDEAKKMWTDGLIDGEGCRVQLGDRVGNDQIFATVWRNIPVEPAFGWKCEIDSGEEQLRYRYTHAFSPVTTRAETVITTVRELLLTPGQ